MLAALLNSMSHSHLVFFFFFQHLFWNLLSVPNCPKSSFVFLYFTSSWDQLTHQIPAPGQNFLANMWIQFHCRQRWNTWHWPPVASETVSSNALCAEWVVLNAFDWSQMPIALNFRNFFLILKSLAYRTSLERIFWYLKKTRFQTLNYDSVSDTESSKKPDFTL